MACRFAANSLTTSRTRRSRGPGKFPRRENHVSYFQREHALPEGFKKVDGVITLDSACFGQVAEGVGFEPTVALRLRLISSQVPLTTQPPFHASRS